MPTRTLPLPLLLLATACPTPVEGVGPPGASTSTASSTAPDDPSTPTTTPTPTTGAPLTTSGDPPELTTAGSGDATGTTASPGEPECGNGIVEEGETCDDGFNGNKPGNMCSETCQTAVCGDGHVQVGNGEMCDDGPLNVEAPGYGECSASCMRGPYCGDGLVQPADGEECEPSTMPQDTHNCSVMCVHKPRLIFLTSASYSGALGGVAGADKLCNEYAAARPDLTGTFRAWLLVDGQSLGDRFPEFADPSTPWNFSNTAADLLAKNFQQLVELGPASPVLYTESGQPLPTELTWTNITAAGVPAGGDCAQWTSDQGAPALVGHSGFSPDQGPMAQQWHQNRWWTDRAGLHRFCHETHHLYCLQVAD